MNQNDRSERSRALILDTALKLFAHRGYGATSVRDIAEEAGLSKGNVYHHFEDKESIFRALLDRYFDAMSQPDFPFLRALASGTFPDNLEEIGRAARETVKDYRDYVALIYVDVVEFDGSHIRKFYAEMAKRFDAFIKRQGMEEACARNCATASRPSPRSCWPRASSTTITRSRSSSASKTTSGRGRTRRWRRSRGFCGMGCSRPNCRARIGFQALKQRIHGIDCASGAFFLPCALSAASPSPSLRCVRLRLPLSSRNSAKASTSTSSRCR
jgi:AcrR family transcriptional regulator